MANVLFVSGSYFPNATANAVCAKKFEEALKKKGHQVFYCNRRHDLYERDEYTMDSTQIYTVGKNSDLFFQTTEKLQSLELPNKMDCAFKWSMRLFRFLMKLLNAGKGVKDLRAEADELYYNAYSEKVCCIIEEKRIDIIISVSMPFASHLVVKRAMENPKLKHRPKWIAYSIDAYWSKAGISPNDIPVMKQEEDEVFQMCDRVLMLDTITKDYTTAEYDCYQDKIKSLPLPLFDLNEVNEYTEGFAKRKDVDEIVFTGTVYDDFRNINTCINIAEIIKEKPYRLHFIGKVYPKSYAQLEALQRSMPDQIEIYGKMPYMYAKGSMKKADILLNLANDNMNQIPSKIFEYMMCLKPILNIYKIDGDVGTEYLKKYPLAFNYKADADEEPQNAQLLKWLETVHEEKITVEELDAIFHDITMEVVVEKFCALCEELIS